MISHFDDPDALQNWVKDITARQHNQTKEMREAAFGQALDERWEVITADLPLYRRGYDLLQGGAPFNVGSLGNWMILADAAGVPTVPISFLGSLTLVDYLRHDASANGVVAPADMPAGFGGTAEQADTGGLDAQARANVAAVNAALSRIEGPVFVRSDGAASHRVKLETYSGCDVARQGAATGFGYDTLPDGSRQVLLKDERLGDVFMGWPEPNMPIWARPLIPARMLEGPRGAYQAEWRVFVYDGNIAGISSYYPQVARDRSSQADELALMTSLTYAQAIIDVMLARSLRPHHPRFELRPDFDKQKLHCSFDFIETADGGVMMIEGGPPHLRNPAYGAHPCSFSDWDGDRLVPQAVMPAGVAWGGGVFESAAQLTERLQDVRRFLDRRAASAPAESCEPS